MPIKLYGACFGEQADKYALWVQVEQNSQSILQNTSNLTIGMYLKCYDVREDSALNLNISENNAVLTVQGEIRVSKNLCIDTRLGNTVKLAELTGDIPHNADGTLALNINGSFNMMGNKLTGGNADVVYNCIPIPRPSTLAFSKESVTHGDTVGVTIGCEAEGFTHEIKWSLGNRCVTHTLAERVQNDVFTIPLIWAQEVTQGRRGDLCARLTTYKDGQEIGSRLYYIDYIIPEAEAFLTEFSVVTERIDNDVPADFGIYVKGKSQVRVNIEDVKTRYGATVCSVVATMDYVQKNTLPAVFDLNKAGYVKINISVTDSRGFTVEKSETIYVYDYGAPALKVNFVTRCDSEGRKAVNGTHLLADLTPRISPLGDKNQRQIKCKFKKSDSDIFSDEFEVNEFPCILPCGELSAGNSYVVAFTITDSITTENAFYEALIPGTSIPFNIKKGGEGAAFGCFAQRDNELTVAWDVNILGELISEAVPLSLSSSLSSFSINYSDSKYFSCLGMGMIHLVLEAVNVIPANTLYKLGGISLHHPPAVAPVNVMVISDEQHICTGYITPSGEVLIKSDKNINVGDKVVVRGSY